MDKLSFIIKSELQEIGRILKSSEDILQILSTELRGKMKALPVTWESLEISDTPVDIKNLDLKDFKKLKTVLKEKYKINNPFIETFRGEFVLEDITFKGLLEKSDDSGVFHAYEEVEVSLKVHTQSSGNKLYTLKIYVPYEFERQEKIKSFERVKSLLTKASKGYIEAYSEGIFKILKDSKDFEEELKGELSRYFSLKDSSWDISFKKLGSAFHIFCETSPKDQKTFLDKSKNTSEISNIVKDVMDKYIDIDERAYSSKDIPNFKIVSPYKPKKSEGNSIGILVTFSD